jgi:glycine dehydrogenase subunit 1
MANTAPASYKELLRVAEVTDIEEVFEQIPDDHRFKGEWKVPKALKSEAALSKHLTSILRKNISAADHISFLGAGCWQHYVPAICDEMVTRTKSGSSSPANSANSSEWNSSVFLSIATALRQVTHCAWPLVSTDAIASYFQPRSIQSEPR